MTPEVGKPLFFNCDRYLDSVEDMINADEAERALWMLDNMPGYYRDYPPKRALDIKNALHLRLYTPIQYLTHQDKIEVNTKEILAKWPLRAQAVQSVVEKQNEKGLQPP